MVTKSVDCIEEAEGVVDGRLVELVRFPVLFMVLIDFFFFGCFDWGVSSNGAVYSGIFTGAEIYFISIKRKLQKSLNDKNSRNLLKHSRFFI